MEAFDLEDLANLEQAFYDKGRVEGYNHGRIHGLIEGRALGCEKGFEIWEEVGFYKGTALFWKSVYSTKDRESRTMTHITHLLELIAGFPHLNPSSDPPDVELGDMPSEDTPAADIAKMLSQIRSKYRALCSTLNIKPRTRKANVPNDSQSPNKGVEDEGDAPKHVNSVWKLTKAQRHSGMEDLAF